MVWFILILLAVIAWTTFTQIQARQQINVMTQLAPEDIAGVVQQFFGWNWTRVDGEGLINVRPKLRRGPPTLSIGVVPYTEGNEVNIWVSRWRSVYGLMNHATLAWRKKRALAARLSAGSTTPASSRPTGA